MAIIKDLIEIFSGQTLPFAITVTNYDDSVTDLTDFTLYFTARKGTETPVISESWACTTDPLLGIAYGTLYSTVTVVDVGNYEYYIEVKNIDSPPVVYPLGRGKLKVKTDISP